MNEQEVRTLLDDLAQSPTPPSRVDVGRAVATARRGTRVRAVTSVAASVLVVGLAAGVTYSVLDRSPGTGDSVRAGAAAPVASAPRQFDALVRYASFGWLPEQDTLDWRTTSINRELFTLIATKYVPDPANGPGAAQPAAHVGLRLYAAGVAPLTDKPIEVNTPDGTGTKQYGPVTDAPAVDGTPASWVEVPDDPDTVILKWRYAPNGWAELRGSLLGGDQRDILHRVASELTVGGTERLRFPFQVTGLPADLRPTASEIEEGGLGWPWQANLSVQAGEQGPELSVGVHPLAASDGKDANTTVGDNPARHDEVEGDHLGKPVYSDRVSVYDGDGFQLDIAISASTAADAAPLGPEGVLGIYPNVTVHPDRANWTDQPLR